MNTKIVKVTGKGQISIPIQLRKILDIERGDELIVMNKGGSLVIKKMNEDDFSDILKINENSLKEIWDNEEDDIWEEYLE